MPALVGEPASVMAGSVFAGLSLLSVIAAGLLLASPGYPEARTMAGMALGCSLHFAFLWAVLDLLSRILGRLERRGQESQ